MVTREELYTLVWSKPMTQAAEQFGGSSGLASLSALGLG